MHQSWQAYCLLSIFDLSQKIGERTTTTGEVFYCWIFLIGICIAVLFHAHEFGKSSRLRYSALKWLKSASIFSAIKEESGRFYKTCCKHYSPCRCVQYDIRKTKTNHLTVSMNNISDCWLVFVCYSLGITAYHTMFVQRGLAKTVCDSNTAQRVEIRETWRCRGRGSELQMTSL